MAEEEEIAGLWRSLSPSGDIPHGRSGHAMIVLDESTLLLWGGHSPRKDNYNTPTLLLDVDCLQWSRVELSDAPAPCVGASLSLVGDVVYILGGFDGSAFQQTVRALSFTPTGPAWVTATLPQPPAPRGAHACTTMADGSVILTGGWNVEDCFDDVWYLGTKISSKVRGMVEATPGLPMVVWSKVHTTVMAMEPAEMGGGAAAGGGAGGAGGGGGGGSVGAGGGSGVSDKPRLPVTRLRGHSMVAASDCELVLFGGVYRFDKYHNDVLLLNTDCKPAEWSAAETRGRPPVPRAWHSATLIGDSHMVVFGGRNSSTFFSDVHVLDVSCTYLPMTWTQPPLEGPCPAPRCSHSAVAVGSMLYIFGGTTHRETYNDVVALELNGLSLTPPPRSSIALQSGLRQLRLRGRRRRRSTLSSLSALSGDSGGKPASPARLSASTVVVEEEDEDDDDATPSDVDEEESKFS